MIADKLISQLLLCHMLAAYIDISDLIVPSGYPNSRKGFINIPNLIFGYNWILSKYI